MKVLDNGFTVDENSDLCRGLKQNFNRWKNEVSVAIERKVIFEKLTVKVSPAYKSIEDSRALLIRFNNLLARDGFWTRERLDLLEKAAAKGPHADDIRLVFSQFRQFLGVDNGVSS